MNIIHLSDLHFGEELPKVIEALNDEMIRLSPDLVIISGDFTQVASKEEFLIAQDFVNSLPAPVFCVPGNHDIPAFNLFERFFRPYHRYKSYINENLCPILRKGNVHIVGLNSARRALPHWNWANGSVSSTQRKFLKTQMKDQPADVWRICVLHHPIHKIDDMPIHVTVFGRKRALAIMDETKIDLVLTGHVHHSSIMTREAPCGHQGVYVSASTAISSRKRSHENGFNIINFDNREMNVESYSFEGHKFILSKAYKHLRKK